MKGVVSALEGTNKVLVCITAQSNSKRLMDCGHNIALKCEGELHILHVLKGDSVFNNPDTPVLLQELFDYGSRVGGMIHAYCDENVPKSIGSVVKNEKMTTIILGEPPREMKKPETHFKNIVKEMPDGVELVILNRKKEDGYRTYIKASGNLKEVAEGK